MRSSHRKKVFPKNSSLLVVFQKSTLINRSRVRLDSAHLNLCQETGVAAKHFQNVEVMELHIGGT